MRSFCKQAKGNALLSGSLQGVREGFRRNSRFQERTLESRLIRNRNAERGLRQNGIPEAMSGIDGKVVQRLISQSFFQRFAVFIRGNMSHDDTQTGIFPLCPERFLNTTEEKSHKLHGLYDSRHDRSPMRYCRNQLANLGNMNYIKI